MKAKQWQEIKSMSTEELQAKLRGAEEDLFRLRFRHAATPVKNGLEIRKLRRNIARFKTLLHAQELSSKKTENK